MATHYRPARDLISSLKAILAPNPRRDPEEVLNQVVEQLYQGRGYFWIGIYLAAGDNVVRQCFRGPTPPCHSFALGAGNVGTTGQTGIAKVVADVSADSTYSMCFVETKSELVQPIKAGARILGVIDVESDQLNAFGSQERALFDQVARLLARYLTTDQGKLLLRKARQSAQSPDAETGQHKRPQSARPELARAAAKEQVAR